MLGSVEITIFISLCLVLGTITVALVCDFLKGNNEFLQERNVELAVRAEERQRAGYSLYDARLEPARTSGLAVRAAADARERRAPPAKCAGPRATGGGEAAKGSMREFKREASGPETEGKVLTLTPTSGSEVVRFQARKLERLLAAPGSDGQPSQPGRSFEARILLNRIDRKVLATALKGTSDRLKDRFLGGLPLEEAEAFGREMDSLGPRRIRDIIMAQREVIAVVRESDSRRSAAC